MAPILDLALGGRRRRRRLGASGLTPEEPGRCVLRLDRRQRRRRSVPRDRLPLPAYVAVAFVKGWLDFGNYLLALWIRVRAGDGAAGWTSSATSSACRCASSRAIAPGELVVAPVHRHARRHRRAGADRGHRAHRAGADRRSTATCWSGTSPRLVGAAVAGGGAALRRHPRHRAGRSGASPPTSSRCWPRWPRGSRRPSLSIRIVKSFGAEAFEVAPAGRDRCGDVVRVNVKFGVYKHIEEPARAVVNYVVEAGLILLAVWELMAGRLAAPDLLPVPLRRPGGRWCRSALLAAAYTQCRRCWRRPAASASCSPWPRQIKDGREPAPSFARPHRVADVSFSYGGEPVLERRELRDRARRDGGAGRRRAASASRRWPT